MRYRVRGLEIRSENAAKPASSAGKWMLDRIRELSPSAIGLDIGCGKLRYTVPLAKRISEVTAVDSAEQLRRKQKLFGKRCSIREHASTCLPNVIVRSLDEREWSRRRYQIILCSNVLSAIPSMKTRRKLVSTAYKCLARRGQFILTTQYRNSHFDSWKTSPSATRYLDGYMVKGRRGTTFYGLIGAPALRRLCETVGFRIVAAGHNKELAFVLATR